MRKRGTPLWVLLYPTPRRSGVSLRSVLRGPQRPITNREGCSVACYAPLSDTEAGVATVPGWGRSVLMGSTGGYADDRINAAVVPLGYGFAAFLPSMGALGRGGQFGTRRGWTRSREVRWLRSGLPESSTKTAHANSRISSECSLDSILGSPGPAPRPSAPVTPRVGRAADEDTTVSRGGVQRYPEGGTTLPHF